MIPATEPLIGRRNARLAEEWQFTHDGAPVDLTGCTARLQLRLYGAQPGGAVVTLPSVTDPVEGVWVREPAAGIICLIADPATLRAAYERLAGGVEPGRAVRLAYDLLVTLPGGADEVWVEGVFTLNPGVTLHA